MLAAAAALLLVALILYDASMRYLFHEGSVALQELEWHLFDIVILFGIAHAMRHDVHVRVDLFYNRFGKRAKRLIEIVTALFFVLPLALVILNFGADFTWQSYVQQEGSPDPGGLCCRFAIKSTVVLAFVLLALQAVAEALKAWKRMERHR